MTRHCRLFLFLFLYFLIELSQCGPSDVVTLTPENFDTIVDGNKHVFVKFYAPWCGHCKNLAPIYEQFATSFKNEDDVVIAELNADKYRDIGEKYNLQGFPTLKFFKKGEKTPEDYGGGRKLEDLVEYVNQQTGTEIKIHIPPSDVITLTKSNFDEIVFQEGKYVMVEFFAPWCGHCNKLAPTYEKLATIFAAEDKVVIAKVDGTEQNELKSRYEVQGFPSIFFFGNIEKGAEPEKFEGSRDLEAMVSFINEKAGTQWNTNGQLDSSVGRIASIDGIVAGKLITNNLVESVAKSVSSMKDLELSFGKVYLKALKKIVDKGSVYVEKEIARVNNMIGNEQVKVTKKKEFMIKRNILHAIQGVPLKEKTEKKDDEKETDTDTDTVKEEL